MSHEHVQVALNLELDYPGAKLALLILSWHACRACGIAWPGVAYLERKTGMGPTTVRKALDWLLARDPGQLLKIHAYPKGGRGVATEYVVLPGFIELSPAPCEECRSRMKTHRNPRGNAAGADAKPTGIRGVSAIPTTLDPQNPSESEAHSVRDSNQSQRSALNSKVVATPEAAISEPPPTNAQEALRRVSEMTGGIGDN